MTVAPTSGISERRVAPPSAHLMQIRDLIYQAAGIFQADNKLRLLEDRCSKRMQALGVSSLASYHACLTSGSMRQAELTSLLNEITIGETSFFRNQPQLDALRNIVLARIVAAESEQFGRHLRIWSAGCSTGEEPYTLSMILLEEKTAKLKGRSFEILATDLNERSVAHAREGVYGDYSTRNLTPYFKQKYFTAGPEGLLVNAEVKARVNFSRVNMLDDARMAALKGVDVILCCNVLIYFDIPSKQRVIQHFYKNLLPHGYLFLGHSESLYGVNDEFRLVHLPSATAYVKPPQKTSTGQVKT